MKEEQAKLLKHRVEELNKNYPSHVLNFGMTESSDDNWFVTIVHHTFENELISFASLAYNYEIVSDRLYGWEIAMEVIQRNKKFIGSVNFDSSNSPQSDEWWDQA